VAIDPGEGPNAVADALVRMRELQTTMRLYAGGISLAPLAWIHAPGAEWRALALGAGGRTDGKVALVATQQEDLQAFCTLIARRRPSEGEAAWALARFELGCEREDAVAGLTDHLLALRALLEPEGPASGRLAGRVAALCAEGPERVALSERVMRASALERAVMAGATPPPDALKLAGEVEDRLRALLRDVICGHLRGDLSALADSLIFTPEPESAGEADLEFRVSRRPPPPRFASDLFATPHPPVHRRRGGAAEVDDGVFEPPTTELGIVR
jgi:hypothetical protein